jgi:putative lipoprotein
VNDAKRLLIGLLLCLLLALPALGQDKWTGPDKVKHFTGGLLLGTVGTLVTESKGHGLGVGCLTGLAKEVTDSRGGTGFSVKDLTVTCAGAWLGAQLGGWLVHVTRNSIRVSRSF